MALLAEQRAYFDDHAHEFDGAARRGVVGNGFARSRQVVTGAGALEAAAPGR